MGFIINPYAFGVDITTYAALSASNKSSNISLTGSNLVAQATSSADVWSGWCDTSIQSNKKRYIEVTITALAGTATNNRIGIYDTSQSMGTFSGGLTPLGAASTAYCFRSDGTKGNNDTYSAYGSAWSAGNVIGIAYDDANKKIWFSINNTWQNSGDPAAGTNAAYTGLSGTKIFGYTMGNSTSKFTWNFGPTLAYSPPAGFSAGHGS